MQGGNWFRSSIVGRSRGGSASKRELQRKTLAKPRIGWQKQASDVSREAVFCQGTCAPRLLEKRTEPCSCRRQGPMSNFPLISLPTDRVSRFDSQPLPHSPSSPPSVAPLPVLSAVAGVTVLLTPLAFTVQLARQQGCWGGGGWALESVAARVCREAGGARADECFRA